MEHAAVAVDYLPLEQTWNNPFLTSPADSMLSAGAARNHFGLQAQGL
jgi:hypothetical protein